MDATFSINVILRSGRQVLFEGIRYGRAFEADRDGVSLRLGEGFPAPVTVRPPSRAEAVGAVEYNLYSDMRNYHRPIVPDSGRWYVFQMQMVNFWRHATQSCINDVKTPLYIFTGPDQCMAMAFGVVGLNYETAFRILEPRHNRALIAYMRRLSMQIRRGTELYPIPDSVALARPDGAVTEHLYFRTAADAPGEPWPMTLRDFAAHQKRLFALPDVTVRRALAPLWCSWTDWMSDDVTDEVVLRNVREGLKLGIRNYIIDDGWFGPGLDNDSDVELNIGDWEPHPGRFPDMPHLVRRIKQLGGLPMVWCAPHAVARAAKCFDRRADHLIVGDDGLPVVTPNGFCSLCFMDPQARRIMGDIAASFIQRWDFDGAKYDLFNCVPNVRCANPRHAHDVSSMIEGLELTLREMADRCRALKPDYVIELKQNYGTCFLARYGTMTRAGDTPYSLEANFLRALHVQAYSPFAANDYQTVTNADSPEDAACVVLKMMAVGIPTYSIDLDRLCEANKQVIARYNRWYNDNLDAFLAHRVLLDGEAGVLKLPRADDDLYFLVNHGGNLRLDRSAVILNATYNRDLFVRPAEDCPATATLLDCLGRQVWRKRVALAGWTHLELLPGAMLGIEMAPPPARRAGGLSKEST